MNDFKSIQNPKSLRMNGISAAEARREPKKVARFVRNAFFTACLLGAGLMASCSDPVSPALTPAKQQLDAFGHPYLGNSSAKITVTKFGDFDPAAVYCYSFYPTFKTLADDYGAEVRFSFVNYPLTGPNFPQDQKAAEALECAADQGKFWEYHDKIYRSRQADIPSLQRYASELGLDTERFDRELASGEMAGRVKAQVDSAKAWGVWGTPSTRINNLLVVGNVPYYSLASILDSLLRE